MGVRVALRADASGEMGSGHVMRCLTLADALRVRGAGTLLLTRSLPESLRALAEAGGHEVAPLPAAGGRPADGPFAVDESADAEACIEALAARGGADRLVVDHYGLGAAFERALRPSAGWIAVIDDLADRPHDCDVLLDQNLADGGASRYRGLVPEAARVLAGPRFALLREQFARAAARPRPRDGVVRELLVFMGGTDHEGMTLRALEAVASLGRPELRVTCVIGAAHPHADAVATACAALPGAALEVDAPDMASLMARADLAIGAAGTATWERCYLGLPALVASFADNQVPVAAGVAAAGAAVDLGRMPDAPAIAAALRDLVDDPVRVRAMGAAARAVMRGASPGRRAELAHRVMAGPSPCVLRPMSPDDEALVLAWRNSDRVRGCSISDAVIPADRHHAWFERALDDPGSLHWVFEYEGTPRGVVNLDTVGGDAGVRSWGFYLGEGPAVAGLGTAMCRLALREAFAIEGASRVVAEVLAANGRSLRLHERLGFKPTGAGQHEREGGLSPSVIVELDSQSWRAVEESWDGTGPCGAG